jgi:CBS domain-containing protein
VSTVCTTDILYTYQDEPVTDALDRMAARGLHQLPVVDRDNPHHILGLLEQEGITLACNLALTRLTLTPYLSEPLEAISEATPEVTEDRKEMEAETIKEANPDDSELAPQSYVSISSI